MQDGRGREKWRRSSTALAVHLFSGQCPKPVKRGYIRPILFLLT
jgi:hypothetical protein